MTDVRDIVIEEKDYRNLSDDDVRALNVFQNVMRDEGHPEDPPIPLAITEAETSNLPDFLGVHEFWARDPDTSIAAEGYLWWRKGEENPHLLWSGIEVRPDRRRCGLAKEILSRLVDAADAEKRTLFMGSTSQRVPSGEAFARRLGAEPGSAVHTNRLVVADIDRAMVREWIDDGPVRAQGYSLVAIDGPYPDDLIGKVVQVHHVMNTAPRDDLDMEDITFTVDHLRQWERSRDAAGTIRWSLFARHDASDELVGFTEVYWNPTDPKTMYQGDTGVDPVHRGHALGKWLKAAMIERILDERPEVDNIRTGNADSNDAMLGINHALGFEPYIAFINWQIPVDRVRDYLSGSST